MTRPGRSVHGYSRWNGRVWFVRSALDGIDEYISLTDVPRRTLATPRRQLPIKSMIEGDASEFRWQNDVSASENCVTYNSSWYFDLLQAVRTRGNEKARASGNNKVASKLTKCSGVFKSRKSCSLDCSGNI